VTEPPTPDRSTIERRSRLGPRLDVGDVDQLRWLTVAAPVGLVLAVVLVAIGGFPFDVPMPTHALGLVEPTCGLTRGSTAIARGDFVTAWHYNPASFLVVGIGVAVIVRAVVGVTSGRWLNVTGRPTRVGWALIVVAVGALWIYQQTNADFIIHSRI
jgi:hypothetical protein